MPILDPGDAKTISKVYNDINDPSPGASVTTANVSGSIIQPYGGQVGKRLILTSAMAAQHSNPTIGTLYEGGYQYVKTKAASSITPARGGLCFWDDFDNAVVTPDVGAGNIGLFAGVYINALSKGNYGYIQFAGKANVLYDGTLTDNTAGDLVVVKSTSANTANALASTTITAAILLSAIGVAIAQPVA